ncbi:hypothetical protein M885DRAFT_456795 [Pelagophyceae sp. CCMP2097]|nr:hypothetical protein M885DRAFT_456795 [Pelagophyceae sp. CCMP2097]
MRPAASMWRHAVRLRPAAPRRVGAARCVNSFAKRPANFAALTPLEWLDRAALVYGNAPTSAPAVVDGEVRQTWAETHERCARLGDALRRFGVGRGDVVQVLLPNSREMCEAQFGVPMSGATLGCLNTRLDAASILFILQHSEAKVLIADALFAAVVDDALRGMPEKARPLVVAVGAVGSAEVPGAESFAAAAGYEAFVSSGDAHRGWARPHDEWDALSLNYTSGTTGAPKGVVLHHRGAYLAALGNSFAFANGMPSQSGTRYLWTLPMFHCNGWCFPYTLAMLGGTNVCLRKVDVESITHAFTTQGVTHACGAPIVLRHCIAAAEAAALRGGEGAPRLQLMVAAAPPAAATLRAAAAVGIDVTHTYGLTEARGRVYGPAAVCEVQDSWATEAAGEQARLKARQGVAYISQSAVDVLDRNTELPVACDGETMGEVVFRGNQVMKGYFKDPVGTAAAFTRDGLWYKTGDLAVKDADGYVNIRDRAKDVVISGGENISSIEVEAALMDHADVSDVAVVAKPCETWGETPCARLAAPSQAKPGQPTTECLWRRAWRHRGKIDAEAVARAKRVVPERAPSSRGRFVELRAGSTAVAADSLVAFARLKLAGFKVPKHVVFGALPKTSTGKVQKFLLRDRAKRLYSTSAEGSVERHSTAVAPDARPDAGVLVRRLDDCAVLHLSLDRPEKRNALSLATLEALAAALADVSDARCVLLDSAAAGAFCAGHDARELLLARESDASATRTDAARRLFEACGAVMRCLRDADVPVVCCVQGAAVGAGLELVANCDIAVCDDAATFSAPGVRIGLFCHSPGVALTRAVGARHAAKMLFTGEAVGAEEALRIGLVAEVTPRGAANGRGRAIAKSIAAAPPRPAARQARPPKRGGAGARGRRRGRGRARG